MAQQHLATLEAAVLKETELAKKRHAEYDEFTLEHHATSDMITDAAVSAIVFAGMAVEAYIYDYSARHLTKSFTDDHTETLRAASKWIVVPQLVTGKTFPRDRQAFQLLKKLVESRNRLVHSKSQNIRASELTGDAINQRDEDLRQNARDAVKAISLLAEEMENFHPEEMAKLHLGVEPMAK